MAEGSSTTIEVKTALSSSDTNLVEAGTPLEVRVSGVSKEKEEEEEEGGKGDGDLEPITAIAKGNVLGEAEVDIREESEGTYVIRLVPNTPDEYTLSVKHRGEHVQGSPFLIIAAEKGSFSASIDESAEPTTIEVGQPVTFLISIEGVKQNIAASVEGSSGVCESSINHENDGFVTVSFTPNRADKYTISVKRNGSDIAGSPFQLATKGNEPDASKCYIVEDDMHVFNKPIRFGSNPVQFRVSTENAGHGVLRVVSQGPGQADVKTRDNRDGTEQCEFSPSKPGKYYVDVLWAGTPISGSPFLLNFRRPKTRIVSDGLNLQSETYRIDVPHKFKLNCEGVGEGGLEITCEPDSAAEITITPVSDQRAFLCQILPKEVGDHRVKVTYKRKDIAGSPFDVHFSPNASKCEMTEGSNEHDIGGNVTFKISTKEAGKGGKLTAAVLNKANEVTIPAKVTQLYEELYEVEFNPGEVMECKMEVLYDKEHIRGSPFNLVFTDPNHCLAQGQGLLSAQSNQWSTFTVVTENAGPGVFKVTITDREGQKTEPTITPIDASKFEVKYRLTKPGHHHVRVQWGKFDVPGSPFEVYCYDVIKFQVKDMPTEIKLGDPVEFMVEGSMEMAREQVDRGRALGELMVDAKSTRGVEVQGEVEQDDSGNFLCRLQPTVPGKFDVNVRWNGVQVTGSPFRVRVITPPIPERVKAHGPGLKDGIIGQEGNFTVETADAGTGLLAVRVHGPKGAFKINTSRDRSRPRSILVSYNPTHVGSYVIEITWAGTDIPGSPFKVVISTLEATEEGARGEKVEEGETGAEGGMVGAEGGKPAEEKPQPEAAPQDQARDEEEEGREKEVEEVKGYEGKETGSNES